MASTEIISKSKVKLHHFKLLTSTLWLHTSYNFKWKIMPHSTKNMFQKQ